MKKVSARLFFTVLWRGLCQALGRSFGLFGYKRDGKFAKCIWGMFATSGSIVMTLPCLAYAWSGAYTVAGIPYIVIGFIAVAIALKLSAKIAKRLNTAVFQKLVNVVLLISAIMLISQTIGG